MAFTVVPTSEKHIQDVYYLQLHLSIDLGMVSSFDLTVNELLSHFNAKLFRCYVLCNTMAIYDRPMGFILFSEDYSHMHDDGVYLESFFVYEGLRNQGLGRLLLKRLCDEVIQRNYNFIKVYFINTKMLRVLYSKMGFCNETLTDQKLQLFEVSGKKKLNKFLEKTYPTLCTANLEIVAHPVPKSIGTSNAYSLNVFQTFNNRMTGFIESIVYNAQSGPCLLFKDFVGDTNILNIQIFKERFIERQKLYPYELGCIWWEVGLKHRELIEHLEEYHVRNLTVLDGYEIGTMYRMGTNNFEYFKKAIATIKSLKCETLTKFEVIYRNVYFC